MAYDESFAETLEDSTYFVDSYDEAYDTENDEAYDTENDEAYDEATRRRPYRRPAVANGRYNRPSKPYQGRATLNTPAGPASLKLPADLVRKDELRAALAAIGSDIKKNSQAVLKINANLNDLNGKDGKSTHALSKRLTETDRKITAMQQQQLFSLLLPTRIEEITVQEPDPGTPGATRTVIQKVDSMKVDNTNALLLTMMGGGFGGGSGGNAMNNMLPILLLTQKENTIGSGNNSTMMLMAMMMMNNNSNK